MAERTKGTPLTAIKHPTDRGEGPGRFERIAEKVSFLAGSGIFFALCAVISTIWLVGLIVGFTSGTENALVGTMTALTLLLVALLKNSELRAERAMQLKLDAIMAAMLRDETSEIDVQARTDLEDAVRLHEEV